MLLLRDAHLDGSLGDFEVIDSRKTVEQRDSTRHGIAVVERGGGDVVVGFGVDSASEVQRGVCAALDSRGKGTEDGFAACDAGIVVVSGWMSIFAEWAMAYSMQSRREREVAALWAAQRQKRRRIVYCFNILVDFAIYNPICVPKMLSD